MDTPQPCAALKRKQITSTAAGPSKKVKLQDPGFLCFRLEGTRDTPKRAPHGPKRRQEIKEMRHRGACLRCRLLKKACSGGNPCNNCLSAAATKHASRALGWMECVRPSLSKLPFFSADKSLPRQRQSELLHAMFDDFSCGVRLHFTVPFDWTLEDTSTHIVDWLRSENTTFDFSVTGLLSTLDFTRMLEPHIGSHLATCIRIMVYMSSAIYSYGLESDAIELWFEPEPLQIVTEEVMTEFDKMLTPREIAAMSPEKRYAWFLSLLAVSLAGSYAVTALSEVDGVELQPRVSPDAGKEMLRLLGHYFFLLGHESGLLREKNNTDQSLFGQVSKQWNKPPNFRWFPQDEKILRSADTASECSFDRNPSSPELPGSEPDTLSVAQEDTSFGDFAMSTLDPDCLLDFESGFDPSAMMTNNALDDMLMGIGVDPPNKAQSQGRLSADCSPVSRDYQPGKPELTPQNLCNGLDRAPFLSKTGLCHAAASAACMPDELVLLNTCSTGSLKIDMYSGENPEPSALLSLDGPISVYGQESGYVTSSASPLSPPSTLDWASMASEWMSFFQEDLTTAPESTQGVPGLNNGGTDQWASNKRRSAEEQYTASSLTKSSRREQAYHSSTRHQSNLSTEQSTDQSFTNPDIPRCVLDGYDNRPLRVYNHTAYGQTTCRPSRIYHCSSRNRGHDFEPEPQAKQHNQSSEEAFSGADTDVGSIWTPEELAELLSPSSRSMHERHKDSLCVCGTDRTIRLLV